MEPAGELLDNVPNNSLMYASYTPTFGNMEFTIAPSKTGEVNAGFGVLPYLSLESLVYQQQMQAQVMPTSILPGQNTGQQNVQGQYTVTDSTGNVRIQMGSGSF